MKSIVLMLCLIIIVLCFGCYLVIDYNNSLTIQVDSLKSIKQPDTIYVKTTDTIINYISKSKHLKFLLELKTINDDYFVHNIGMDEYWAKRELLHKLFQLKDNIKKD